MGTFTYDVRDIPILTEAIDVAATIPSVPEATAEAALAEATEAPEAAADATPSEPKSVPIDTASLQAAITADVLALADSLTSQAAREIESLLFERVLAELRAQLPQLIERTLRAHLRGEADDASGPGEPDG